MAWSTAPMMDRAAWLMLICLSVLWGGTFFFTEVALIELPPFTIVCVRVAIAALVLNLLVLARGERLPLDLPRWRAFLVMGALNNFLPFSLIAWGQTEITGGLAAILIATTPLFGVLLAHFLTRDEPLSTARLGGVVIGFLGIAAMLGPTPLAGLGGAAWAEAAILGAALSYAVAGIFGRRFRGLPPMVIATGQVTCSTGLLLPVMLLVDQPWTLPLPGIATWLSLIAIGLFSTALAYILYFQILARAGATNLLLVTFLIPISAALLGVMVLDETLTVRQLLGMALIGLGLAAIDGRTLAWFRPRRRAAPAGRVR
jgi:drug/metabolite transporter (DMT)-like permease